MNCYLGIFQSPDNKLRSEWRGEEADTVFALSYAAAKHKLLFKDVWTEVKEGVWELIHYPIHRKYPLKDLVCLYQVT